MKAYSAGVLLCVSVVVVVLLMTELTAGQAEDGTSGGVARRRGNRNRGANNSRNTGRTGAAGRNTSRGRTRGSRKKVSRPPADCEEIWLPMCKGLIPYTHTKLPNSMNHTTQLEVYRHLEHLWSYMDHSCSKNTRVMICAKYLPKCTRHGPGRGPCKATCMRAKRKCARPLNDLLGLTWGQKFACRGLPTRKCVKPVREARCPAPYPNPNCFQNSALSVCTNLTFTWGTMPNMFQQCHFDEINTELSQFSSLQATNCHMNLNFLLCGVYSPFCINGERPFTFPCRELCDEVRSSCESHFRRLNHQQPWPNKLQCHRFPLSTDDTYTCVMPDEGGVFGAN